MSFQSTVRMNREKLGLTQDELGSKVGLTGSSVSQWEAGRAKPRIGVLKQLAELFSMSTSELLGEKPQGAGSFIPVGTSAMVPMRVLGKTHAGEAIEEIEDPGFVEVPETVARNHPDAFMLRVEGCCMNRSYPDGCLVMVDPTISPWNGCAVVAEPSSGESVLRRYYRGQSSLLLTADSYESYDDLMFSGDDEVMLLGVVVWFQAAKEESE
ncbi:LexA family transcriptional regulator [uncultured Olegusella sp.]|uniref:LexA family protein n=1 Tax=uncultured Olegusella sp. TaxID=1979846 RepID=UPI002630A763|nr:LexA family transcriptional regulator [uncultured Olegusella sp.]